MMVANYWTGKWWKSNFMKFTHYAIGLIGGKQTEYFCKKGDTLTQPRCTKDMQRFKG